ncbi:MAG: MBL fold metallo-hydrolase [Desulfurococcales archaeon]|nr:MBL fold metallo-hydrolase [Desulfurococcales archaeon]
MEPVRVKVWLPIRSLGWVNSYILGDTVIDPGMFTSRSILDLVRGLRGHMDPCRIGSVIVTHFHVDHSTAALLLSQLANPRLYIGRRDLEVIRGGVDKYIGGALELFKHNGMPGTEIEEILKTHPALRLREVYEEASSLEWTPLSHGDHISIGGEVLKVIEAPGHTPGHILLHSRDGWMIVGDTLLPGITPHVTIHDWNTDPLKDYLNTLKIIEKLSPSKAYPGHRDPITSPAERAREIIRHHDSRLNEIIELLKKNGPMTGYEIAKKIKWRTRYQSWAEYPHPEKFFAMGEALAHLKRLEEAGLVTHEEKGGTWTWRLEK